MNFLKKLLPLFVFFFVTTILFAQTSKNGYATMRVFDCNKGIGMGVGYLTAKIVVVYEDGSVEETELLPYSEKAEIENLKKVTETLNKMKAKGYFLITQSTTGEQGSLVTDYTFLKQP